jgi:hypothetical protein
MSREYPKVSRQHQGLGSGMSSRDYSKGSATREGNGGGPAIFAGAIGGSGAGKSYTKTPGEERTRGGYKHSMSVQGFAKGGKVGSASASSTTPGSDLGYNASPAALKGMNSGQSGGQATGGTKPATNKGAISSGTGQQTGTATGTPQTSGTTAPQGAISTGLPPSGGATTGGAISSGTGQQTGTTTGVPATSGTTPPPTAGAISTGLPPATRPMAPPSPPMGAGSPLGMGRPQKPGKGGFGQAPMAGQQRAAAAGVGAEAGDLGYGSTDGNDVGTGYNGSLDGSGTPAFELMDAYGNDLSTLSNTGAYGAGRPDPFSPPQQPATNTGRPSLTPTPANIVDWMGRPQAPPAIAGRPAIGYAGQPSYNSESAEGSNADYGGFGGAGYGNTDYGVNPTQGYHEAQAAQMNNDPNYSGINYNGSNADGSGSGGYSGSGDYSGGGSSGGYDPSGYGANDVDAGS